MRNDKSHIIRYSCLTGKAIWVYHRNISDHAIRYAYRLACKHELNRVRNWGRTVARRKENIQRLLSKLTEKSSIFAVLPPNKMTAIRQILSVTKEGITCHEEFYNHILQEQKLKKEKYGTNKKI